MWAAAFVLATVVAAIVWTRQPTPRRGVIAAAWAAAALLTRFPVGVGAAAAVAVAAVVVARRRPRAVVPAAGILVAAVATHMTLNVARFGSLLHLPADRQVLTLDDPERAAWFAGNGNSFFGLRFLPTTLAHYVRPDTVAFERLVPFIRFGRPAVDYADYPLETTQPAASLTATATALVVLAVIGLVFIIRRRQWLWLALTGAAAVGAVPTLMIGFIANRYLADLLPALVVPAAVAAWALEVPAARGARAAVATAAGAVLLWGLWSNVALALWGQNLKEAGFTELRYRVDRAVFGGDPPAVVSLGASTPVGRDGVVGVAPGCAGVYIAEQGHWVPLERSPGQRVLRGTVDGAADRGRPARQRARLDAAVRRRRRRDGPRRLRRRRRGAPRHAGGGRRPTSRGADRRRSDDRRADRDARRAGDAVRPRLAGVRADRRRARPRRHAGAAGPAVRPPRRRPGDVGEELNRRAARCGGTPSRAARRTGSRRPRPT